MRYFLAFLSVLICFGSGFAAPVKQRVNSAKTQTLTKSTTCAPLKSFYEDRSRGWYWYEECEIADNSSEETQPEKPANEEQPKYRILPEKVSIPWDIIDKLDPDDVQKIEYEARKISIMYPTDENLYEYKMFNRWFVGKSLAFSDANTKVTVNSPETIDYALNISTNTWGIDQINIEKEKNENEELFRYSQNVALLVFATETCPYCKEQRKILELLKKEYGYQYEYQYLSELSDNSPIKQSIATVPDIFIVVEKNEQPVMQRISTGLTTYPALKKSILQGLGYVGIIDRVGE